MSKWAKLWTNDVSNFVRKIWTKIYKEKVWKPAKIKSANKYWKHKGDMKTIVEKV